MLKRIFFISLLICFLFSQTTAHAITIKNILKDTSFQRYLLQSLYQCNEAFDLTKNFTIFLNKCYNDANIYLKEKKLIGYLKDREEIDNFSIPHFILAQSAVNLYILNINKKDIPKSDQYFQKFNSIFTDTCSNLAIDGNVQQNLKAIFTYLADFERLHKSVYNAKKNVASIELYVFNSIFSEDEDDDICKYRETINGKLCMQVFEGTILDDGVLTCVSGDFHEYIKIKQTKKRLTLLENRSKCRKAKETLFFKK